MASRRHKKKKRRAKIAGDEYKDVELMVMPFIDVFSILVTFLLTIAVFVSFGIHEVQIPFLSSEPITKADNERSFEVKVEMEKRKLRIVTSYSRAPISEKIFRYELNTVGVEKFHKKLVDIRMSNPDTDKLTFFTDDDVVYEKIIDVLDAIKMRKENDPSLPVTTAKTEKEAEFMKKFLFPKVVMGSVIL